MLHEPILHGSTARRITVMQGQSHVSGDPHVELTTVLGSCIATCLYDAHAHVGGMNHFLLAEPISANAQAKVDEHYGVYLMELLINEMLANGATRSGLRAHLYGGANLHVGMTKIGSANAVFARSFLEAEKIPLIHADMGGSMARRVDFRPAHGQARCRHVEQTYAPAAKPIARPARAVGDVELF